VRLDGDEMAADADDGDAGHYSGTYICRGRLSRHLSFAECAIAAASSPRTTTAVMSNVSTRGLAPHGSQYTRPGQSRRPYGTTRNATMAPAMATPKAARSQPFTGAIVRRAWTRDAGHATGTYIACLGAPPLLLAASADTPTRDWTVGLGHRPPGEPNKHITPAVKAFCALHANTTLLAFVPCMFGMMLSTPTGVTASRYRTAKMSTSAVVEASRRLTSPISRTRR
jgi:hypothetical protein